MITTDRLKNVFMSAGFILACAVSAAGAAEETREQKEPPKMLTATAAKIKAGERIVVVMYGDSISEVGRSPRWHGGASNPGKNWGALLRDKLAQAYPDATFEVRHFGIGGQNSYEGLGRLDWLAEHEPDLAIVAFGTNDCSYHLLAPEETFLAQRTLVEWIKERFESDVVVVGTGGDNPEIGEFQHIEKTNDAIQRAAKQNNVPFVDIRKAILDATDKGKKWTEYHLFQDNCHPNDNGHKVWAQATFDVIFTHLQDRLKE